VAERYVSERPDNLDHVSARLQVLVQMGRYEDVIRDAKEVLRKDERNVQAMISMATAYRELGKHELAESVLLQVAQEVGEDAFVLSDVRYRLGYVYLAMEKDVRARGSFEEAVKLRPDFVEARNSLGVLYHRARDYTSAIEQFEAAVQLYPNYKEAYLNLGNAYKGKKSYAQAEDAFKRAIRVDTGYAWAYFNLGIMYLDGRFEGRDRKEQFQQAIDNFNRYKTELGAELPREDPTDKYIGEALKKIELEKQREQQEREAAMEPEEFPEEFPEEGEEFPEDGEEFPEEEGDK
jgi:tetratricopeptide (TPR) repeat protein